MILRLLGLAALIAAAPATATTDPLDARLEAADAWFGNYGKAPPAWPHEAGSWIGMRIAQAFVARSTDSRAAIETLLAAADPGQILAPSGYDPGVASSAQ